MVKMAVFLGFYKEFGPPTAAELVVLRRLRRFSGPPTAASRLRRDLDSPTPVGQKRSFLQVGRVPDAVCRHAAAMLAGAVHEAVAVILADCNMLSLSVTDGQPFDSRGSAWVWGVPPANDLE